MDRLFCVQTVTWKKHLDDVLGRVSSTVMMPANGQIGGQTYYKKVLCWHQIYWKGFFKKKKLCINP